jgi:A/G-specific adenine glycosylase
MTGSRRGTAPEDREKAPAKGLFARRLLAWYARHRRKLPWRASREPYRIWVSEIMLQQTTVQAVVPYYERWLTLFPDIAALARAPLRAVLRAWQGLGYYERARNLHRTARIIVRDYGGHVPDDERILRSLPGFGPYTTAAVLSLAFDRPLPVIDANVRRVLMRIVGLDGEASARHDRRLLARLRGDFPVRNPGLFNQAMMELGALVCRNRNPLCLACPVSGFCAALKEGRQETIPRPRRQAVEKIEAVVAVILDGRRLLIQQRPAGGLFGGLWDFPGGKKKRGESREAALRREIREELGAEITDIQYLTRVRHAYTRFRVSLSVFSCRLKGGRLSAGPGRRWVTLESVRRFPLPSASVRIVNFLSGRAAAGRSLTSDRSPGASRPRGRPARPGPRSPSPSEGRGR